MVCIREFLCRLVRDRGGNTLVLVAAAMVPLLGIIGGGVDMSRNYLTSSRLQQACDAGVLAARKALGSVQSVDSTTADRMKASATRFFDVNFGDGAYGSRDRHFAVTLNSDLSIDAKATATVPTTLMGLFGIDQTLIEVDCSARLNVTNTDVVMALDVTGSMNENTPGDSVAKIDALKLVVKQFHAQLEAGKVAGSRIRYGFVPYSTNVNVGHLLKDEWVVPEWTYQSRVVKGTLSALGSYSYYTGTSTVSGYVTTSQSTYAASYNSLTRTYSCPTKPSDTATQTTTLKSTVTETITSPLPGTRTTKTYNRATNGNTFAVALSGTTCTVTKTSYVAYVDTYALITEPALTLLSKWEYRPVKVSTSGWRTKSNGCIEERATYAIDDYTAVDLARALDLDIDLVPDSTNPSTQWRPQLSSMIYDRAIKWDGTGAFNSNTVTTNTEYIAPWIGGFAACPAKASKLAAMTTDEVATYVNGLKAGGSTYHDIGMIWAGRLLSPTGPFAEDTGDVLGHKISRHLIFLTDGQTSALDLSYGAYGVEPLDKRRWDPSSKLTLNQTVEKRFTIACEEVKKKNITVWFIAFGTGLNSVMTECAGEGHYFAAANSDELDAAFAKIARSIGELRLTH